MASRKSRGVVLTAQRCKGTDLGTLQEQAEQAASHLKGARTEYLNAKQKLEKAEETYAVAQKSLIAGVAAVQTATKVG
jgi:hypothetical protein